MTDADIVAQFIIPARKYVQRGGERAPTADAQPMAASLSDERRLGSTDREGVFVLPSKLSSGATHVAVRLTDQGRRFFFGDSKQHARKRADAADGGIDPGDRSTGLLREAGEGSFSERTLRAFRQTAPEALNLLQAQAARRRGDLNDKGLEPGGCFQYSAKSAVEGLGDMLVGQRSWIGPNDWHAVVRLPDGEVFEPTSGTMFKPGVYERMGFTVHESLTPSEVRAFEADHGTWPAPHLLGLTGIESSRQASEPGDSGADFQLADAIPKVQQRLNDLFETRKTFNVWHKTVGTQYHKAQVDKDFKRVFERGQQYLHDVSRLALGAADRAPDIIPKLDTLKDLAKSGASPRELKPVAETALTW